ncbi:hypothetical protein HG442_003905 [Candidatus Gracilibacteria bacterium]|nr:hypothetical protein [Candidatus Gracilibacteria bacterium]
MSKIKTASFLGFVAILTGLLNYITHPILIRYLSERDYVQVGVYVSMIGILSIPASGFGSLMLELFRSDKSQLFVSKNFQKELWKYSFFYGIFSIFGVFLGIFFLDLPISIMTFFVIIALIPGVFGVYYYALLQSREVFFLIGWILIVAALARFFPAIGVIAFPYDWLGMIAFVFPIIISPILYYFFGKKYISNNSENQNFYKKMTLLSQSNTLFWYMIVAGLYIFLQNIDVIFAKIIFSDAEVLVYMSVAVMVKFSLVLIGIFETVSLPVLMDSSRKIFHKKYIKNLILLSILGFIVSFVILPYIGNFALNIIKPGLYADYLVWAFLGASSVSLGFFVIFAKFLIAQKISWKNILVLPIILMFGFFWIHSLIEFSGLFALIIFCLYGGVLYKIFSSKYLRE